MTGLYNNVPATNCNHDVRIPTVILQVTISQFSLGCDDCVTMALGIVIHKDDVFGWVSSAGRARWCHSEFYICTWQWSCCLQWPPSSRRSPSRKWSLSTPWYIYHPVTSLFSHSHRCGLVHGSSKLVPNYHWSVEKILFILCQPLWLTGLKAPTT